MNENDEGEKIGKPKKKGPMKAYPIYPFHKQPLMEPPSAAPVKHNAKLSGLSRRSPSPSPLQRTRSNDSFGSRNSPNSSRGVSPVQSYLQGQWPTDIRNSLPSRSDNESQTDGMDCEIESCENCATNCGNKSSAVRLLSDDGQALRELRRIGSLRDRHGRSDHSPLRSAIPGYGMEQIVGDILSCVSPKKALKPIGIKNRQGSLDNLNEELVALNKTNDEKTEKIRIIGTPTDR